MVGTSAPSQVSAGSGRLTPVRRDMDGAIRSSAVCCWSWCWRLILIQYLTELIEQTRANGLAAQAFNRSFLAGDVRGAGTTLSVAAVRHWPACPTSGTAPFLVVRRPGCGVILARRGQPTTVNERPTGRRLP